MRHRVPQDLQHHTHDQDRCRFNTTSGSDLPREKTAELIGRLNDGAVAANVVHGTARVHFLGACDPRHIFHGQAGCLACFKRIEEAIIFTRPDKADEMCAFFERGSLFV